MSLKELLSRQNTCFNRHNAGKTYPGLWFIGDINVFLMNYSVKVNTKVLGGPQLLRKKVSVSGINWECLTVRTISLQFDIGLPTTRKVLTYYLRIERTCSHCVPYCFQTMTDKIKVLTVVDLIDNHLF